MIYEELYEKTEGMLISLDGLIANGHEQAGVLKLAREHVLFALAYIAHDRMDEAGDHLTAARGYLSYVKGAA